MIVNAKAKAFKKSVNVHQRNYIYQETSQNWLDNSWRTANRYLTDETIEAGINNEKIIGYFLSILPKAFCIDIDDHAGKGEGFLYSVYRRLLSKINLLPSVICKTPNGLHVYYFLDYCMHINILISKVREIVKELPVEIKPTDNIGARVPRVGSLLDAFTLEPLEGNFEDIIISAERYHPAEIFSDNLNPVLIRQTYKERKNISILQIRESRTLAKFEYEQAGIDAGQTNEALCNLIPMYRSAGLTPEEAARRFSANLSLKYNGELLNKNRLVRRIKSFYRNMPDNCFNTLPQNKQPDFFSEKIAERIVETIDCLVNTRQQKAALTAKKQTAKKAIMYLENWKHFIDSIKKDRKELEYWNYIYPFFKKNTSEGYYPIPRNMFKKIHERYDLWLLPHLREVGYLERSPYGYSNAPDKSTCYHWKINGGYFI